MKRFVVLDKPIGQTPLECMETWRAAQSPTYADVPMTYAGRLDPMANGALLILIGEECKNKDQYLNLDKEYEFEVLFGVSTDTHDVLGLITETDISIRKNITDNAIKRVCETLTGDITLPYPHFSSKTVDGKPLHQWTLEGRVHEIEIPTKASNIYTLRLKKLSTVSVSDLHKEVLKRIDTIAPVTDPKKALGADFRRQDVCASWKDFHDAHTSDSLSVARFSCIATSGTYMRTLATVIGQELGTVGLAYSINRTKIGHYQPLPIVNGIWTKKY